MASKKLLRKLTSHRIIATATTTTANFITTLEQKTMNVQSNKPSLLCLLLLFSSAQLKAYKQRIASRENLTIVWFALERARGGVSRVGKGVCCSPLDTRQRQLTRSRSISTWHNANDCFSHKKNQNQFVACCSTV